MKKILIVLGVAALLTMSMIVGASAYEIKTDEGAMTTFDDAPDVAAVTRMMEVFELQQSMGFIPSDVELLQIFAVFDDEADEFNFTFYAVAGEDTAYLSYSAVSSSGQYQGRYVFAWGGRVIAYKWNWETGFTVYSGSPSLFPYPHHVYYSSLRLPDDGTGTDFAGINGSAGWGQDDVRTTAVMDYYKTIKSHIQLFEVNGTQSYMKGYSEGYYTGYENGDREGYNEGLDDGYDTGYTAGYTKGSNEGYDHGYTNGFDDGFEYGDREGYDLGFTNGYQTGYLDGEEEGYQSGLDANDKYAFEEGYDWGYEDGYTAAEQVADEMRQEGYNKGYAAGQTDAMNTLDTISAFVDGIVSAPINVLYTIFDVEVFGINLYAIISIVLGAMVVLAVAWIIWKILPVT